jgi:hypothetical protein
MQRTSRELRPGLAADCQIVSPTAEAYPTEALILDSGALNALAKRIERGFLADRVRAILEVAMQRGGLVRVPAPVLAEVCRGPRFDAAVNHVLSSRGVRVENLTESIARRAGAVRSARGKYTLMPLQRDFDTGSLWDVSLQSYPLTPGSPLLRQASLFPTSGSPLLI